MDFAQDIVNKHIHCFEEEGSGALVANEVTVQESVWEGGFIRCGKGLNKPPIHMGSFSLAKDPIFLAFGGCVKGRAFSESLSRSRLLQLDFSGFASKR